MSKYPVPDLRFYFLVYVVITLGLFVVSCGEPAKSATAEISAITSGKVHLRCRCNRYDGRGCVHWQCRRANR